MKQPPKLTLINNILEQNKSANTSELLAVESLSVESKDSLIKTSKEIFPNCILVAAIKTTLGNVCYPVILLSESSSPSVLRVVREKNSASQNMFSVLGESLSRYNILRDLSKDDFSWGILNKEIWYCRRLFDKTLEQKLHQESLNPYQAYKIALNLLEQIEKFQQNGLIHGHICPANVYLGHDGDVQLLDPFIAINQALNPENYFKYDLSTFAPEFFAEMKLTNSIDLYGIGLVLKSLHNNLETKQGLFSSLELAEWHSLKNIYELLLDRQTEKRLPLDLLKSCLANSANNLLAKDKLSSSQAQRLIAAKDLEISTAQVSSPVKETVAKSNAAFYFILLMMIATTGFIVRGHIFSAYNNAVNEPSLGSDLKDGWASKIPSRMQQVALEALSDSPSHQEAEAVIVSSARRDEDNGVAVNNALIKIAFKDSWEMELGSADRRAALVLGLGGLLKKQNISDLPSPKSLHPGVVLAILASLNNKGDSTPTLLNDISAEVLLKLPVPYGEAFKYLFESNPNLNCSDPMISQLAFLGTRGIELEKLSDFIKANPSLHLKALAKILSTDLDNSKLVVELLIKNPLFSGINLESLSWAKGFSLIDWQELNPNHKLSLIAGVINFKNILPENVLKLITHPSLEVRSFALGVSLLEVKFQHPSSIEVVKMLQRKPDLLSAEQTIDLVKFLIKPNTVDLNTFSKWLEKKPDQEILKAILLGSVDLENASPMDTVIASELKKLGWKPTVDILRKLSSHPDKFTRLFAYNELYLLEDRETAKELLGYALKSEKDEAYKEQLKQMIMDMNK